MLYTYPAWHCQTDSPVNDMYFFQHFKGPRMTPYKYLFIKREEKKLFLCQDNGTSQLIENPGSIKEHSKVLYKSS